MTGPKFSGEPFSALLARWGVSEEIAPMSRCLADSKHRMVYNENVVEGLHGWWVASAVPCSDIVAPELLTTQHSTTDLDRAIAEHNVLAERTAIALEYARSRRLQEAALAAITDANQRLDWVGRLLIESGNRPVNPTANDRQAIAPPKPPLSRTAGKDPAAKSGRGVEHDEAEAVSNL